MIIVKTKQATFEKAARLIGDVGKIEAEKNGNYLMGTFSLKGVSGKFSFDAVAEVLKIVITDKPWLASESMIEKEIRKFFN